MNDIESGVLQRLRAAGQSNRQVALMCAAQIAAIGDGETWSRRTEATLEIAERFMAFLEARRTPEDPPAAPAAAQAVAA